MIRVKAIPGQFKVKLPNIDNFGKAKHIKVDKLEVFQFYILTLPMPEMLRECDADPASARGRVRVTAKPGVSNYVWIEISGPASIPGLEPDTASLSLKPSHPKQTFT